MSEDAENRIEAEQGEVKWFDSRKGFGFIIGPDKQDIFVHFTVIQGDGYRVLKDGSIVVYDAENSAKGWRATKVEKVETGDESDPDVVVRPRKTYSRTPRR